MLKSILLLVLFIISCSEVEHTIITVDYDPETGSKTKMDVIIPKKASGSGPAIFMVHGGGWETGDKNSLRPLAEYLADLGFVAVTVGYRLLPKGVYPLSSQDISCAWDSFITNAKQYGFDPKRVALFGYSAGAQLISLLATGESLQSIVNQCDTEATGIRPAAAISSAGILNLLDGAEDETMQKYLGGGKDEARNTWIEASPITHVDKSDPPFLFIHGEGDVINPIEHSEKMYKALKDARVEAKLMVIPGGGHLFNPGPGGGDPMGGSPEQSPEALAVIEDFLYDQLGKP